MWVNRTNSSIPTTLFTTPYQRLMTSIGQTGHNTGHSHGCRLGVSKGGGGGLESQSVQDCNGLEPIDFFR